MPESSSSCSGNNNAAADPSATGTIEIRYEIPSEHTDKGFVVIRQPERNFNVSKDNKLAQRDLKREGVEYRDWAGQ